MSQLKSFSVILDHLESVRPTLDSVRPTLLSVRPTPKSVILNHFDANKAILSHFKSSSFSQADPRVSQAYPRVSQAYPRVSKAYPRVSKNLCLS